MTINSELENAQNYIKELRADIDRYKDLENSILDVCKIESLESLPEIFIRIQDDCRDSWSQLSCYENDKANLMINIETLQDEIENMSKDIRNKETFIKEFKTAAENSENDHEKEINELKIQLKKKEFIERELKEEINKLEDIYNKEIEERKID